MKSKQIKKLIKEFAKEKQFLAKPQMLLKSQKQKGVEYYIAYI